MNDKTKIEFENGMILETRNKRRGILLNETIYWENGGRIDISNFDQNLKLNSKLFSKDHDIMKIYNLKMIYDIRNIFLDKSLKLIWQRKEIDITNPDEIETLKALLKLDLKFITKDQNGDVFAFQNEPRFEKDCRCWLNKPNNNNYSNTVKIEKGFEWIEHKGIINIKEILDDNL